MGQAPTASDCVAAVVQGAEIARLITYESDSIVKDVITGG